MKVNMQQFNGYLTGLGDGDAKARRDATGGLAKYSDAEWEGTPEAVVAAVAALIATRPQQVADPSDAPSRGNAAKALGNIGTRSPAVVPELLRLLREDADNAVRTEAARALGKIGVGAGAAGGALVAVLAGRDGGDVLRCEAARALARTDPQGPDTAAALRAAADDDSGSVGVCAAEALWRASGDADRATRALVARLGDAGVRAAAAQVLYRMGPQAKAAVPALLVASEDRNRLFHESVVMALQNIDPRAAASAGVPRVYVERIVTSRTPCANRDRGPHHVHRKITEPAGLGTPIQPQQLTTTTTLTSGKIDMKAFRRVIFSYNQGTFGGTGPTCSAAATLQTSPDGSTWTDEANDVGTITIAGQNTGLTKEIRASQITAGKRYARLQVVCTIGGTSPTIPVAGLAIGLEAYHKPGSAQNDTATYPAANQNVT
jgi:HEAT repeat protein